MATARGVTTVARRRVGDPGALAEESERRGYKLPKDMGDSLVQRNKLIKPKLSSF